MTSAIVVSVLVLAAAHVSGAASDSPAKKPQSSEVKAQETVNLTISGMT